MCCATMLTRIFSVVFTGVLFGFAHLANLTGGAAVMRTIQQVIY